MFMVQGLGLKIEGPTDVVIVSLLPNVASFTIQKKITTCRHQGCEEFSFTRVTCKKLRFLMLTLEKEGGNVLETKRAVDHVGREVPPPDYCFHKKCAHSQLKLLLTSSYDACILFSTMSCPLNTSLF